MSIRKVWVCCVGVVIIICYVLVWLYGLSVCYVCIFLTTSRKLRNKQYSEATTTKQTYRYGTVQYKHFASEMN